MSVGIDIAMTTGKSSLATRQKEIALVSNNIANSDKSGYHRQSAMIESNIMIGTSEGYYGTGSHISKIVREYDSALETSLRSAQTSYAYRDISYSKLGDLEDVLAPSGANFLNTAVQDFATSVQDVATSPESSSARSALLGSAKTLTDTFNQQYSSLVTMRDNIATNTSTGTGTIKDRVTDLNKMLEEVVSLNDNIQKLEDNAFINQPANELRDQRDQLVTEIAKYVSISVREEANHKYTININTEGATPSYTLVDGATIPSRPANSIELTMTAPVPPSPTYTPQIVLHDNSYNTTANITLAANAGEIRALMDTRTYIADRMSDIYSLASQFGDSTVEPADWAATTAKVANNYVIPVPPNGYAYKCTTAGTTGAAQPAVWNTTLGGNTNDGTVVWETVRLSAVNVTHMDGFDLDGNRGGKFFDLSATQPSSGNILSLSTALTDNPRKIAATDTTGVNGNGQNMLDLWNTMNTGINSTPFDNESILSYPNTFLAKVAQDVYNANKYSETTKNIVDMFTSSVNEVSSVNMDDELTNMLEIQRAYQASAKFINVIDEMTQTVLSIA